MPQLPLSATSRPLVPLLATAVYLSHSGDVAVAAGCCRHLSSLPAPPPSLTSRTDHAFSPSPRPSTHKHPQCPALSSLLLDSQLPHQHVLPHFQASSSTPEQDKQPKPQSTPASNKPARNPHPAAIPSPDFFFGAWAPDGRQGGSMRTSSRTVHHQCLPLASPLSPRPPSLSYGNIAPPSTIVPPPPLSHDATNPSPAATTTTLS
jgi:hypothetical protein